jgi:putative nucleotidyltransferase with HDIG domain
VAFGVLAICAANPESFMPDEMALLKELAGDLAFGILTLRMRIAHENLQQDHLKGAERLKEALTDTIRAVSLTVEKRDPYTAGHQNRVAELCVAIARKLGVPEDRIEGLRLGALIHDIGKISIPSEILNRPGGLSEVEFQLIRSHPQVGYDIVKDVRFPWPVAQMILQHHERLDGSGYPQGLKHEEIILEARILAVADTVEAMVAHRPYRPGRGIDTALAEIKKQRGTRFDTDVVDACLRLFTDKGFAFSA